MLTDQVRLYPTTAQTLAERTIIGARTVEERADYWIVRPASDPVSGSA